MKTNQKGFALVEGLLILIIVGMLAGIGLYVWNANNSTTDSLDNLGSATNSTNTANATKLSEYKNEQLALSIKYPKRWGTATLSDGQFTMEYQHGQYKQLTFSKAGQVDIDFVLKPYFSPLDGCGITDPVLSEKYSLSQNRGSRIGWDGDNLKGYYLEYGTDNPKIYLTNIKAGDTGSGWVKISEKGKVLVYKDTPSNYQATAGDDVCQAKVTQAQANEANDYNNYFHLVVNYSNDKVAGVNAHFDARQQDNQSDRDELVDSLNSLTNL
jgi:type II secretory pathway pseudopilin PulG